MAPFKVSPDSDVPEVFRILSVDAWVRKLINTWSMMAGLANTLLHQYIWTRCFIARESTARHKLPRSPVGSGPM